VSHPCDTCKGDCCGPVPIPARTFAKHKAKLSSGCEVHNCGEIVFAFKGVTCGFLNEKYRCRIYADRPDVCRKFGSPLEQHPLLRCPHGANGMPTPELRVDGDPKSVI
jgi:Fe-S-cluster containining protein